LRYIPNSPDERAEMLRQIGVSSMENLFDSIPADLRLQRSLNVPTALSELELLKKFETTATRNPAAGRISFLGAGAYSHYIPTVVDSLISRSEFFTAYTPYQPEISQGHCRRFLNSRRSFASLPEWTSLTRRCTTARRRWPKRF
jgi:glycine dehydrogenase subunit 1